MTTAERPTRYEIAASEARWRERMNNIRTNPARVALLVDMVEAHMAPTSYDPSNLGGRCAGLLKAARDPLRAVGVLWRAMRSTERAGDPVQYAMGMIRFNHAEVRRIGHDGDTTSTVDYVQQRGLPVPCGGCGHTAYAHDGACSRYGCECKEFVG